MIFIAQTDPAWEYWDTNTYLAIALALIVVVTTAVWLVYTAVRSDAIFRRRPDHT